MIAELQIRLQFVFYFETVSIFYAGQFSSDRRLKLHPVNFYSFLRREHFEFAQFVAECLMNVTLERESRYPRTESRRSESETLKFEIFFHPETYITITSPRKI